MVKRKEFFVSLLFSLLFFLVPTLIDLFLLMGSNKISLYPAWAYFGLSGRPSGNYVTRDAIECFQILILPFLCTLVYSCCIFDEHTSGVAKFVLPRSQRANYYLSGAIVSFLGAFIVIFIPMIVSQLAFSIAVPFESMRSLATEPIYDNAFFEMGYWKGLALNSPYFFNLLYCFIPALIGGLVGLMSFSISLIYKRRRFLVLTLPGLIWWVSSLAAPMLGHPQWTMGYMIAPPIGLENMRLSSLIISTLTILGIDVLLLVYKMFFVKDEL